MISDRMVYMISIAGLACMMLTSCVKENGRGLNLVAENHQGGTKTSVNGTSINWVNGDKVDINNVAYTISYTAGSTANVEVTAEEHAALLACYPADVLKSMDALSITVDLPASYIYAETDGQQSIAFPMVAKGEMEKGGSLYFKHLCAGIEVKVKNTTDSKLVVRSINVASQNSQLCGERTIDISGIDGDFTVAPANTSNDAQKHISLALAEDDAILDVNEEQTFQLPTYPITEGDQLTFTIYSGERKIEGVLITALYTYHNTVDVTNEIARATVASTPAISMNTDNGHVHRVSSKFTVNSNGTQVFFSQGILQYSMQRSEWRFASHQYAGIGDGNLTSDDLIDLFSYGQTDPNSAYVNVDGDVSGGNNDWARAAGVVNGGRDQGDRAWRSMKWDEWKYLLYKRNTGIRIGTVDNASYMMARVNGHNGVVLFPDAFDPNEVAASLTLPVSRWSADAINTVNYKVDASGQRTESESGTVRADVTPVQLPYSDWAILEAAGCVYMVADGWINGGKYKDDGNGYYWMGSQYGDNNQKKAYDMFFNNKGIPTDLSFSRPNANTLWAKQKTNKMAVRMVRDVEAND